MKKSQKILLVVTIIVVILGTIFIVKMNKASNTRLVEKLEIYKKDTLIGQTVLGSYVWNNPTTNLFKENFRMDAVPANVLLEETLELRVKTNDELTLKINPHKYNITAYNVSDKAKISYISKNGELVKETNGVVKNNEIKFTVPDIKGIYYVSAEVNYNNKGTVYNYIKFDIE